MEASFLDLLDFLKVRTHSSNSFQSLGVHQICPILRNQFALLLKEATLKALLKGPIDMQIIWTRSSCLLESKLEVSSSKMKFVLPFKN